MSRDECIIERVKARLLRLKKRYKTWRRVGEKLGVNHYYLVRVMQGEIPSNPDIRRQIGFPKCMPSERRLRERRPLPRIGSPGWEAVYLKYNGRYRR